MDLGGAEFEERFPIIHWEILIEFVWKIHGGTFIRTKF